MCIQLHFVFLGNLGHSIGCLFHSCSTTVVVHHNPPSIHCAGNPTVTAPVKSETVKVTWVEPKGAIRHGQAPNTRFSEGVTTIKYTIKDGSTGLSNSCTMKISVKVVRCPTPALPLHGSRKCSTTHGRMVYGDTCSFICNSGYYLDGSAKSTCSAKGKISTLTPVCKPVPCGNPQTIANGRLSCNGHTYGSVCHVSCDNGYTVDSAAKSITCQANRLWSSTRGCLDLKPPLFLHCPSSKLYFADRGQSSTIITWNSVTAHDPPTNKVPLVKLISGPPPGSVIQSGVYLIEYQAIDAAGNLAVKPCSFNVTVRTIHCPSPRLDNKNLLQYTCPSGYSYGHVCYLSCVHGDLAGPNEIICETDQSFPPKATWSWNATRGIKPYCKVLTCPPLRPPRGGALSCDDWQNGGACQMQCLRGHTFPASAIHGIYKCAQTLKRWLPTSVVPDCLARSSFFSIQMPVTFYYHGRCNGGNMAEIRRNFLSTLRYSLFGMGMCKNVRGCQAQNVRVTCGSKTIRSSRGGSDASLIQINVVFSFPYILISKVNLSLEYVKATFVSDINTALTFGLLDLKDHLLTIIGKKTYVGDITPMCRDGQKMVQGGCSGCGPGYVLDKRTESCRICPLGFYQELDGATSCQSCPPGQTTIENGASSFQQCKAQCPTGTYSDNGLAPCQQCPLGYFQSQTGSTRCQQCPLGTTTSDEGIATLLDCHAYDIKLSPFSDVTFKPTTRDLTMWSYSLWMKFVDSNDGDVMLGLWTTKTGRIIMHLSLTDHNIHIVVHKSQVNISSTLVKLKPDWNQFTLTSFQYGGLRTFVNGIEVMHLTTGLNIPRNSYLHIATDDQDVLVSRLILHDYVISDVKISDISSRIADETPRELDLADLNRQHSDPVDVIFPTTCSHR